VVFSLDTPNADFAFGLASRWSYVLPAGQDTPNVLGEGDALYANFNGTGAFILSEYRPGESATFTANPDYWMPDAPALDSVRFLFIDEQQAQIDALRTGVVDFIFKVSFDRVPELEALDGISVISKPTNQHAVIRLRVDEGRLGEDPAVVQAFKLATDRELLNLDLFDGLAAVGNNDPIGPLYGPFFTQLEQAYDPELACTLLADAGYPAGLGADEPIPFYVVDALNYQDLAINLQEQWAEGCINVDILMRPENVYYGDNEWLEVDLGITGWGSRPIPKQYLVEAYITGAPFNETHWSDAALDALVTEASLTADIEARAAIYAEIAAIFADRGPIIVPFFAPIIGAVSDRVTGLDMHPFPGSTDLRTAGIEN
jgi:peptide/nickel transport system substrate-binding protein